MKCALLPLLCICPLMVCKAGSVQLWSGEVYNGRVWPEGNQLTITPDQGKPIKVEFSAVRDAVFSDPVQPADPSLPAGMFLTNGDFIAGNIQSVGEPVMKVNSQPVPTAGIAWIVFKPVPRDKLSVVTPGHTGAILPDGQFFEGAFVGIRDYRVGINSPLLGPQRLPLDQIAAIVMCDRQESRSLYTIILNNGSRYQADDLQPDKQNLIIQDSIVGKVKIQDSNVQEIASGGGRFQLLTSAKPVDVSVPAGMDAADAVQVLSGTVAGTPDILVTRANAAVSYVVPPGFQVFTAMVAVPKDAPPGTHLTFAVYGDGKFLIQRSLPVSPGDPPQSFKTEFNNVHTIVLRAEPAFAGPEKAVGQWIEPMMMRP